MNRQLRGNLPPNERQTERADFFPYYYFLWRLYPYRYMRRTSKCLVQVIADADKFPIIGANIVVKGTTIGTVTDVDGKFTLDVPQNSTIAVSCIVCRNARNQDYGC